MDNDEKAKLNRFANDVRLFEVVKKVFEKEIVKNVKDRDVNNLAARFIALELIRDVFREIENYKDISEEETIPKIRYV